MKLNSEVFEEYTGNRRDNLIKEINMTLKNNQDFGIGGLELYGEVSSVIINNPDYACKKISYKISTHSNKMVK